MTKLLDVKNLTAFYGDFQALFGIDFSLEEGETISIIGSNGAGKSTFLRSLMGLIQSKSGQVVFSGTNISESAADDIHKLGLAMVPEGRRLFPSLSVEENLMVGATGKREGAWDLHAVYDLFPALVERRTHGGTELSGGQQQMVAIGRALMSNPKVLFCDEISLGLAPKVTRDIYKSIPLIRERGTSLVLIEQDIAQATKVADRIYCFQEGKVSLSGDPNHFTRDMISDAYFGTKETV